MPDKARKAHKSPRLCCVYPRMGDDDFQQWALGGRRLECNMQLTERLQRQSQAIYVDASAGIGFERQLETFDHLFYVHPFDSSFS